jgi:hypothetical protein
MSLTYDDYALDTYSVFPIGIVARLCLIMSSRLDKRVDVLTV